MPKRRRFGIATKTQKMGRSGQKAAATTNQFFVSVLTSSVLRQHTTLHHHQFFFPFSSSTTISKVCFLYILLFLRVIVVRIVKYIMHSKCLIKCVDEFFFIKL
ncbi:hypothetical protein ACOSP7_016826 [Xanthoceras sorbifolium]